jgi:hypothetical protein
MRHLANVWETQRYSPYTYLRQALLDYFNNLHINYPVTYSGASASFLLNIVDTAIYKCLELD